METSTARNIWCLGNRRLASGAVETTAKGTVQLTLDDESSGIMRHFGGGVYYLIRGGRGSSIFETESAELYGTVNEDITCSSYDRINHTNVKYDLVRDACDSREVRVVRVKTRACLLGR